MLVGSSEQKFLVIFCAKVYYSMQSKLTHNDDGITIVKIAGNMQMTNACNDSNIHRKAFRLPKYLQKHVVYVHLCM